MLVAAAALCIAVTGVLRAAPAAGMVIDIAAQEQYTAVMRAEEFVNADGSLGPQPPVSVFIGLLHVAVVSGGGPGDMTATIQTTVWHQVAFATLVAINGPAAPGKLPPAGQQAVPLLTLAAGGAATADKCPIQGTWTVSTQLLAWMRANLLFATIVSPAGVGAGSGNLRGAVYSGRDALVAFLGGTPGARGDASRGMGVFRAVPVASPPGWKGGALCYLNFWILSPFTEGQFASVSGGANFTSNAVFGLIPAGQSTAVTLAISDPTVQAPVVTLATAYTEDPIVGVGSTNMVLILNVAQQRIIFSQVLHVAYYTDYLAFNSNGTSAGAALRPAWWLAAAAATAAAVMIGA